MTRTPYRNVLKRRLAVIGGGILLVVFGALKQQVGQFGWRNWYGQPVFSAGVISLGAVIIAVALIPSSWVAKFATLRSKRPAYLDRGPQHSGKQ